MKCLLGKLTEIINKTKITLRETTLLNLVYFYVLIKPFYLPFPWLYSPTSILVSFRIKAYGPPAPSL